MEFEEFENKEDIKFESMSNYHKEIKWVTVRQPKQYRWVIVYHMEYADKYSVNDMFTNTNKKPSKKEVMNFIKSVIYDEDEQDTLDRLNDLLYDIKGVYAYEKPYKQ